MPVLPESDIPAELWTQSMLFMPLCLQNSYDQLLADYQVKEVALRLDDVSGPIGGRSPEETLQHFALRFGVSACRVESLALDPKRAFQDISDNLIGSLSDGLVSILDVPCGTGAVGASLISTITVLRACSVLPKQPLDIVLTGGDYSQTGLDIYAKMIDQLRQPSQAVGVVTKLTTKLWDAADPFATAALVDTWFRNSAGSEEYLVIIANISGEASKMFTSFERSFQHIHERVHDKKCTMIWVEPEMPGAKSFLEKIQRLLLGRKTGFGKSAPQPLMSHTYDWWHPLQRRKLPCRLLVYRYERC
jgi:SAM-dependent methyltransferase